MFVARYQVIQGMISFIDTNGRQDLPGTYGYVRECDSAIPLREAIRMYDGLTSTLRRVIPSA